MQYITQTQGNPAAVTLYDNTHAVACYPAALNDNRVPSLGEARHYLLIGPVTARHVVDQIPLDARMSIRCGLMASAMDDADAPGRAAQRWTEWYAPEVADWADDEGVDWGLVAAELVRGG